MKRYFMNRQFRCALMGMSVVCGGCFGRMRFQSTGRGFYAANF